MPDTTASHLFTSPLRQEFPESTNLATVGSAVVAWDFGDLAAEYAAIRGDAARIDLSGAGLVEVSGPDAYDLVQFALARDLEFVTPEQSLISAVLDEAGNLVDLVTAYHSDGDYLLETAIGQGPATVEHLTRLAADAGMSAEARLVNDERTVILLEGPKAARTAEEKINPDLSALPLFGLLELEFEGRQLIVSRTGFTGEYGYKIFVSTEDAPAVWSALEGVPVAGVGALEVAMFEVRQPLLNRETDDGASVLQLGIGWLVDITKEHFCGREAIQAAFDDGVRAEVVGFTVESETLPEIGTDARIGDTVVGRVLHAVYSPGRGAVVGLLRMRPDLAVPNLDLALGSDGVAARTLYSPYVIPASWKNR